MKKLIMMKASGIGSPVIEDVEIGISSEIPENLKMDELGQIYDNEAKRLLRMLADHLPSGTMDRLMAKMLMRNASLLKIPCWGQRKRK